MPVQPINIIGGAYSDDNRPWSAQDTVNWLPVTAEVEGARSVEMLRTPPGLRPFINVGSRHRGARNVEGRLFVVSGEQLFQVFDDGTSETLGVVPGRSLASMTHNQITGGNELVIGTGDGGYVWNTVTETLTQITDDAFLGFLVCDYINSLIVGIDPSRRNIYISQLADALNYNALERFEAESSPDLLRGLIVSHLEVWVFGERTIEVFENTGAENAILENKRIVIETGCAATHSIKKVDNSIVFLGHDGSVYQTNGYSLVRISTHAMEQAISRCQMAKAFAFTWEDRGHKVYYLTFPDGQTWGFDFAVRQWHRRQTEGMDRWRLSTLVRWNDHWYGGAYNSGVLYELDWDYHQEGCDALIRERTTPCLHANQNRVIGNSVELVFNTGGEETECVSPDDLPDSDSEIAAGIVLDLAGWWTFDNTLNNAHDAARPLVASSGAPTYSAGKKSQKGSPGSRSMCAPYAAAISTDFCWWGWIYTAAGANGTQFGFRSGGLGGLQIRFVIGCDPNGLNIYGGLRDSGGGLAWQYVNHTTTANTYYFCYAAVNWASETLSFYVNDTLIGSANVATLWSDVDRAEIRPATGTDTDAGTPSVDEWGWLNGRVLTAAERSYLYNSGAGKSYAEVMADAS